MINAKVINTELSFSSDNIPYVIFDFQYNDPEKGDTRIATPPILLINPQNETLQNSSLAYSLKDILNTVSASRWEDIVGKIVRLDFSEEGLIQTILHPIADLKLPLITREIPSEEGDENKEPEIIEVEEVKE